MPGRLGLARHGSPTEAERTGSGIAPGTVLGTVPTAVRIVTSGPSWRPSRKPNSNVTRGVSCGSYCRCRWRGTGDANSGLNRVAIAGATCTVTPDSNPTGTRNATRTATCARASAAERQVLAGNQRRVRRQMRARPALSQRTPSLRLMCARLVTSSALYFRSFLSARLLPFSL